MMTDTTADTGTSTNDAGNTQTTADTTATTTADTTSTQATATTTTETKAPEAKAVEAVVPESYEFAMPEGVQLDKTAADEFSTIAKELKLDQATAQKVADIGAKMAQRQTEAHAELVKSWTEAVKSDKEIGGDKLAENLGVARKALETFGDPELRDVLNSTGLGNHPGLIKMMHRIGKAISEDRFVSGTAKGADTDMAKRMFPSMN
jgi:hypothetical protein